MKVKRKWKFTDKRRHQVKRIINYGLYGNINQIHCQLHRIYLFGNYNYDTLKKKLGRLKSIQNPENRRPAYDRMYVRQLEEGKITIFVNPNTPNRHAHCFLEYNYPTKSFLSWLQGKLPELKVSMVEYAMDFYCHDFESFFNMIHWHLYVSNARKARLTDKNGENRLYRVGNIKVYERGNKKTKHYYARKDIDRVRLEYTAKRAVLKKNGIDYMYNLIEHPNFLVVNFDKYKFRKFKDSSKKLPKYWEGYIAEDEKGKQGAFQQQSIYEGKRKEIKNLAQSREDISEFTDFLQMIREKMYDHDSKWHLG